MTLDSQNLFSEKQRITTTAFSQHSIATGGNMGAGQPLFTSLFITDSFAGATGLTVEVQDADTESGPFTTIQTGPALKAAALKAGSVVHLGSLPAATKRFLRLNYVVSGTATAGTVTAGLLTASTHSA